MMIFSRNRTPARAVTLGLAHLLFAPVRRVKQRGGVDKPRKWRAPAIWVLTLATGFAAFVFAVWLGWSIYVLVLGAPSGFAYAPDRRCALTSFSCGAVTGFVTSGLLLALASAFLLWRLYRVLVRYRGRARNEARELVPTAGTIIGEVVGREQLCKVVMEDLHDRRTGRPHVLIGGVGTGKTAVLVRLTEFLADRRAVPVPLRLRDAVTELDFETMAQERFTREVDRYLLSSAEGEKIWRRLRKDGRVVVLADGLEEALIGGDAEPERDNLIRAAIRKAHRQQLPLIIASRPHDPLRGSDAAILVLEPLSYEAALTYVGGDEAGEDERRLDWIVETADVVEAPLYLQITRELHEKGLLEHTTPGQDGVVDTRGLDRSRLRHGLLRTWERALVGGHIREEVPLNRAERQATVEWLSALACVGLQFDTLDVGFDDLLSEQLAAAVRDRLSIIEKNDEHEFGLKHIDVRLAAAWGARLKLVEAHGNRVRFPHSLLQAYLGSRLIDAAMLEPGYCWRAMQRPRPSREFLIALVLRSRVGHGGFMVPACAAAPGAADVAGPPGDPGRKDRAQDAETSRRARPEPVGNFLRNAAAERSDNKALDIYAAALEIDCVAPSPDHVAIAKDIAARWTRIHAQDPSTLEEGKLGLVRRFGEAVRAIDARRRAGDCSIEPAYQQLYAIGCCDPSYPVRHAVAQEIGIGGDAAYRALRHVFTAPCRACETERDGKKPARSKDDPREPNGKAAGSNGWYAWIMSAWLAPLLVGSVGSSSGGRAHKEVEDAARDDLARWLRHVGSDDRRPSERDLPLSLEIALAQGFKYAANRRYPEPHARRETRVYLAEQTLEMLKGARYWFSKLTLIQALCLWHLTDGPRSAPNRGGSRPDAIVQHWLDVAGRKLPGDGRQTGSVDPPHPFVREAADLAVLALKTGLPERYCWIDESGVVARVGSNTEGAGGPRKHHLWIPPSTGWSALDGRAQRLVADVLLLLNLAERGDQPRDLERRLARANRSDLPPCITRDRHPLDPRRTVGMAASSAPGTNCVDGCVFELCPYPPKGAQPRVEMSEAFCRRQQTLLHRYLLRHGRARWQKMGSARLTEFWTEMAERARGPHAGSAVDATTPRN